MPSCSAAPKASNTAPGLRMTEILRATPCPITRSQSSRARTSRSKSRAIFPPPPSSVANNAECAEALQQYLGSARFRIYSSDETVGIELGGALKNVFAIPAGVSDGLGFGDNSKAALVTRALAEMLRLGTAMGGNARTFYGLERRGRFDRDLLQPTQPQSPRRRTARAAARPSTRLRPRCSWWRKEFPTTKSAYECARRLGSRDADHRSGLRCSARRQKSAAGFAGVVKPRSKIGAALRRASALTRKTAR